MREIKFRGKRINNGEWVYGYYVQSPNNLHKIYYVPFEGCSSNTFSFVDPATVGQFTGFYDKTNWDSATEADRKYAYELAKKNGTTPESEWKGREIYYDDIARIKGVMGNSGEYQYDALYKVTGDLRKGLTLTFIRLFNEQPDCLSNSYPINTTMSFYNRSIDVDYAKQKYDHLVVLETWGENYNYNKKWKEHHYTDDIQIIGNIYDNPELLNQQP